MKTFKQMLKTELKLSLRGMDMPIFAIILPLIVFVIIGIIYGNDGMVEGENYTYLGLAFGGVACISIAAGGMMGLPLVISDYRSKKILRRLQVTPVPVTLILIVELLVYFIYAFISLITLSFLAIVVFKMPLFENLVSFFLGWLLVLISIFSIGLFVGGVAKNAKSAGVIASALYFPMLLFSGATLPYEVMPEWMQKIVDILPLTQGIKVVKTTMLGLPFSTITVSVIILSLIAILFTTMSIRFFKWE